MSLIAHASSDDHQDILWQMNMRSLEQMVSGSYPVREGEPDCSYYMRTGESRFGATCRFNHPPYRTLATANGRIKGMYPERRGQPACQFYLKTGTCKSGATCKFHHPIPRNKARIAERVALNVLGYPLRPNEIECAFYMRNGQCKFGSTCKFNHPQPANIIVSLLGSTLYPPIHSPTTGELSFARVPFVPKPRRQSPSSYAPHLMAQGVLSVPLNTNTGQVGPVSPGILQHIAENSQNDGMLCQGEGIDVGSELESNSLPIRNYDFQKDNLFPERLGQPECQFYMKTGECRFGALCKFHHPRERLIAVSDCLLNPMGLPLRPGKPLCIFFSQYGVCKFGPSCKFDHPMRVFAYNAAAASSPTDGSVYRHFMASVPGTI